MFDHLAALIHNCTDDELRGLARMTATCLLICAACLLTCCLLPLLG